MAIFNSYVKFPEGNTAELQHQEEVSAHINRSIGLPPQPLQRSFVDVEMRPVPRGFQHEEILLQGAA